MGLPSGAKAPEVKRWATDLPSWHFFCWAGSMQLPSPYDKLAGCVWLPRIIAKARLSKVGKLEPDYAARFCHRSGVDGQFLGFFNVSKESLLAICDHNEAQIADWFLGLRSVSPSSIEQWNQVAVNLGKPGFPMADRLPIALATSYKHLASLSLKTVFEVLAADERSA